MDANAIKRRIRTRHENLRPYSSKKSKKYTYKKLKNEQHISACVNNIVNLAIQEKDHATTQFFQWFVGEQVEEEANAINIVEKMKMIGDNKSGIFMLDRELGRRQ